MDIGTLIIVIVVVLVLLFLLFLPKLLGAPTNPQMTKQREAAYRRGLLIGGLMEEAKHTRNSDPQQIVEQVLIEQSIIEHLQQQHNKDDPSGEK